MACPGGPFAAAPYERLCRVAGRRFVRDRCRISQQRALQAIALSPVGSVAQWLPGAQGMRDALFRFRVPGEIHERAAFQVQEPLLVNERAGIELAAAQRVGYLT